MKKQFKLIAMLALTSVLAFSSCKKEEENNDDSSTITTGNVAYIVNYGVYGGAKGEISVYNTDSMTITNNAYNIANSIGFNSVIQNMGLHNNKLYLMSNDGDKIDVIDARSLQQTANPTTSNIVSPRFFVADGTTAYVSCWGVADWSVMADSYIAKIDLLTLSVTKIALPGGPEGLAIANGKLYAALNFRDSIATMDLGSNQISYIETPAVPSYFLKDNSNNLYVLLGSTYGKPSTNTGLGYINTTTDVMAKYDLDNVSADSYVSIMAFNSYKSKIYVVTASYDANWVKVGGIKVFNTTSKTFESTPFVTDLTGINGVSVNPANDDVYVLMAPSATANGSLRVYTKNGVLKDTKVTGIGPQQVIFYKR